MVSVACCFLSVVFCMLYVVCCMLSVVSFMLYVICCMVHFLCCLLSVVCCMLYAVCCLLSVVCCMLYVGILDPGTPVTNLLCCQQNFLLGRFEHVRLNMCWFYGSGECAPTPILSLS